MHSVQFCTFIYFLSLPSEQSLYWVCLCSKHLQTRFSQKLSLFHCFPFFATKQTNTHHIAWGSLYRAITHYSAMRQTTSLCSTIYCHAAHEVVYVWTILRYSAKYYDLEHCKVERGLCVLFVLSTIYSLHLWYLWRILSLERKFNFLCWRVSFIKLPSSVLQRCLSCVTFSWFGAVVHVTAHHTVSKNSNVLSTLYVSTSCLPQDWWSTVRYCNPILLFWSLSLFVRCRPSQNCLYPRILHYHLNAHHIELPCTIWQQSSFDALFASLFLLNRRA